MVMAEAQACGRPIVAFARGGALEVVSDGVTGILFEKQTADSLCDALTRCEKMRFDSVAIRASALRFNIKRFEREFSEFVERAVESSSLPKHACAAHPTNEGRA
jgi:glycosyltransferase involved in cell wall biosynthesis